MGINIMRKTNASFFFVVMLLLVCACSSLDKKDVTDFVARREVCDHLRGEFPDPPDPKRTKEIFDEEKIYCTGSDAQLENLKKKYKFDEKVMTILNSFDEKIEAAH